MTYDFAQAEQEFESYSKDVIKEQEEDIAAFCDMEESELARNLGKAINEREKLALSKSKFSVALRIVQSIRQTISEKVGDDAPMDKIKIEITHRGIRGTSATYGNFGTTFGIGDKDAEVILYHIKKASK